MRHARKHLASTMDAGAETFGFGDDALRQAVLTGLDPAQVRRVFTQYFDSFEQAAA